jgi:asparagine synthase (glutamine-hydrolysing)
VVDANDDIETWLLQDAKLHVPMCGIAGKVSLSEPVERPLIERMCEVIEHRGPDSRGIFLENGIGLGVQRLRIIDLQTGDQPLFNEDRSVVVVLNGEIYNYRELRTELEKAGHVFATRSDTEAIVHLYEDLGTNCVSRLRGMFAFALWDSRRRQLLLARDRLGKKPLFYALKRGTLWFGSETRAILEDAAIERKVDFEAIDSFLQLLYVPAPFSAFAALRKLPPAHTLIWRDGQIRVDRYWRLSYRRGDVTEESEAHELIRRHLLEATRLRLRSDVPLGAFLSGGVDSSAVVAAMAQQTSRVKTFSIGFDVDEYDETPYAREVAKLFSTEHHELRVEAKAMEVLPRLVWHYGEPFADSSAIPSFYLSELTSRHVTVALNGDGGDENFAGYTRYLPRRADRFLALPRLVRAALATIAAAAPGASESSFRTRFERAARVSLLPPRDRYARMMAYFDERERTDLYTPEFREALGHSPTASKAITDFYEASDGEDEVSRLLDVDVQTYLSGDLLVKMDIASMAHSLEVRSPLLDHELMEMSAALPGHLKLNGGMTKKIFKDALRIWLPGHILDRGKAGFAVPISKWFRSELRELPREVLLDPDSLRRGFFREERLRALIDAHQSGNWDNSHKLWALIQLELWLSTFIDGTVSAPPTLNVTSSSC